MNKRELVSLKLKYEEDVKRLDEMKEEEMKVNSEKIKVIEDTLWKEYTQEDVDGMIEDYKEILTTLNKIEYLKKELEKYKLNKDVNVEEIKKEIEETKKELDDNMKLTEKYKLQKELYECPCCGSKIKFQDNTLQLSSYISIENIDIETVEEKIKVYNKNSKKLNKDLSEIETKEKRYLDIETEIEELLSKYDSESITNVEEITDSLEYIKSYKNEQNRMVKEKEMLNKNMNVYSSSYINFKKQVDKQLEKINSIKEDEVEYDCDYSEEELSDLIFEQQKYCDMICSLKKNLDLIEKDKRVLKDKIEKDKKNYLNKYESIRENDEIMLNIQKEEASLVENENKKIECEKNIFLIQKYERYIEDIEKYNSLREKVEKLKEKEKKKKEQYCSSLILKDKIAEAESISLSNIISSINSHANIYLDHFFTDNPISVILCPFKETKTAVKPQINIEIEYKSNTCDLTNLSGGELARVVLAFTLALSEMFNTPLLMLDECTASLDQETTNIVFSAIRENFKGKTVLAICHQVVMGSFDNIVSIS